MPQKKSGGGGGNHVLSPHEGGTRYAGVKLKVSQEMVGALVRTRDELRKLDAGRNGGG